MKSKKRFFLLLGTAFLLLFLSFQLAISKTLSIRKEYNTIKIKEVFSSDLSKDAQLLKRQELYYDSILTDLNITNTSIENDLLRTLNSESQKTAIKVKSFNTPHLSETTDSNIITYEFTIEGEFISLLKLIYDLEKQGAYGEVKHLEFRKQKDFKTKRIFLSARVLIQTIQ